MSAKDDAEKDPATDDEAGPEEETASDESTDDSAADTTEPEAEAADEPEVDEPEAAAAPEPAAAAATAAEPAGAGATGGVASARSWLTTAPLWQVGVVAVLIAAVAAEVVGGLGKAIDVPMEAPQSWGSDDAEDLSLGTMAIGTIMQAGFGVIVALLLAWKARQPAKIWLIVALVGTVLSFGAPITAENTTTSTKLVLSIGHVVVAAIVIPLVMLRLTKIEEAKASALSPQPEPA